jgi:DNA-binding ferritin-like protein
MLQDLLVLHIAIRDYLHTAHVSVKGSVFYTDHELLSRLYTGADAEVDGLMEKMVGIGMGVQSIHLPTVLKKVYEKVSKLPYDAPTNEVYFQVACSLEESLRQACEALDKDPNTSVGVRNMIGDLADKSENRCYLIKQRLGK